MITYLKVGKKAEKWIGNMVFIVLAVSTKICDIFSIGSNPIRHPLNIWRYSSVGRAPGWSPGSFSTSSILVISTQIMDKYSNGKEVRLESV